MPAIHLKSGQAVQLDDTVEQAELRGLLAEQQLARIKYRRLAPSSTTPQRKTPASRRSSIKSLSPRRLPVNWRFARSTLVSFCSLACTIVPIEALNPLYIDFSLPEREISKATVGQLVTAAATAVPGRTFAGAISAIDPAVDVPTRRIRLRAAVPNQERLQCPGMFVDVHVQQLLRTDKVMQRSGGRDR